jgi:hypothetical protein
VTFDGRDLENALRSGDLAIAGDQQFAASFLGLYPARERATAPG